MTKSELVSQLASSRPELSRKNAERVVNTIFGCFRQALEQGERVEIRGFGTFQLRTRAARTGRNPKTGQAVEVSAKNVPFFRVGKELRSRVDRGEVA